MSVYGIYPDFLDNTTDQPACRSHDTGLFFPEAGDTGAAAKDICAVCPLQIRCRNWALSHTNNEVHGIWGGLSDTDRRQMKRAQREAAQDNTHCCQHCGTYVGNFRRIHMARYHADMAVAA